jgi:hypothetical protein
VWEDDAGFEVHVTSHPSKSGSEVGYTVDYWNGRFDYTTALCAAFSNTYSQLEVYQRKENRVFLQYDTISRSFELETQVDECDDPTLHLSARDIPTDVHVITQAARDAAEVMTSITRWTSGQFTYHSWCIFCYDEFLCDFGNSFRNFVEFALVM